MSQNDFNFDSEVSEVNSVVQEYMSATRIKLVEKIEKYKTLSVLFLCLWILTMLFFVSRELTRDLNA